MKLEQIMTEWEKDSVIDRSELGSESANIPIVHHKYYKMYMQTRMQCKRAESELKQLRHAKYEFYTQGPNEDTPPHWKLPAIGRVIKSEVNTYIEVDPDVVKATLALNTLMIKLDYITDILKMIVSRGYNIRDIIEWEKFKVGK